MAVMKLTEGLILKLPFGSGITRDSDVKGLMVIAHKTTKTYACQGDVRRKGRFIRTVRVTIDRTDRISLKDARTRAKGIMSQIQSGVDPTAGPAESGITLERALDAHLEDNRLRPRTVEAYEYIRDRYLKGLKKRAVADISRQEVRDLYVDLKRRSGETTAAGAMRVLRAVINTAMRIDETLDRNPVDCLKLPSPKVRKCVLLEPFEQGPLSVGSTMPGNTRLKIPTQIPLTTKPSGASCGEIFFQIGNELGNRSDGSIFVLHLAPIFHPILPLAS